MPASRAHLRTLALIWLGWSIIMLAYPVFARARVELQRPDNAMSWTAAETGADANAHPAGLIERIVGPHAAWDSEYYLSIARHGYDDPDVRALSPASSGDQPVAGLKREHPDWTSVNYAFFPGYPFVTRIVAAPLAALGLSPVAAAETAGVIVSLLGALAAMIALADLVKRDSKPDDIEADGRRAAFYLLVMPASFFLAQIYTEGLFLALSFGALALMRRQRWLWAAALAAAAVWTRATGAILLLPFLWTWVEQGNLTALRTKPSLRAASGLILAVSPAIAYLGWKLALGHPFELIETRYFGRGVLLIAQSWASFGELWQALIGPEPSAAAYAAVEFAGVIAGVVTGLALLRRDPALALYGLAVLGVAMTSGGAQGMHRYVLSAPALYLVPARWGRAVAFDRVWTLGNGLVMAVFALTFAYGFWAG